MSSPTPPSNGTDSDRVKAVNAIMASFFANIDALKAIAPEFKWSNTVGDYGEFWAAAELGLTRLNGTDCDAVDPQGRTVQVKCCRASGQIGYRGMADRLLVLAIGPAGIPERVYDGPFKDVEHLARFSKRDTKWTITLRELRKFVASQEAR